MDISKIQKLLNLLPEGPKKNALLMKINKLNNKLLKRDGEKLDDLFEFKPKGHITIEEIDEDGEVVEVLADKPNLVVNGAEEIILRAFSGDPSRILYKNRIPKNGETKVFYIDEQKLSGLSMINETQLLHAPNIFWSVVDDDSFDVSYGYYPVTVYLKEEPSLEFNKKAFRISSEPGAGYVPISSEIYSSYTNLFIGIGEGESYNVSLKDERLNFTEGVVIEEDGASLTEGQSLEFKEKITNFSIDIEASADASSVTVHINGELKRTIDFSSTEVKTQGVMYDGFDPEQETSVKITYEGVGSGSIKVKSLRFDALHEDLNGLMSEFKDYEKNFLTPTVFNTTPMAPFTVQIPHYPIKKDSVNVLYNDIDFKESLNKDSLSNNEFFVDYLHGVIYFSQALTGLLISYSITGEIYDIELPEAMIAEKIPVLTTVNIDIEEQPVGNVDGTNKLFTLTKNNIVDGSIVIKVNGTNATVTNIDYDNKQVELAYAPNVDSNIVAYYQYIDELVVEKDALRYTAEYQINTDTVRILDDDGNELSQAAHKDEFDNGKFMLDSEDPKSIIVSAYKANEDTITKIEVVYRSDEKPGVPTNYSRAIIEKPKITNEYPWFDLDKGSVRFIAEFPEFKPSHNIIIREMGLFDGPRPEDNIAGFNHYPVKAFSLVRVDGARKDVNTGIRVTWTITLVNGDDKPFKGGRN